jgi:hypothetical protein
MKRGKRSNNAITLSTCREGEDARKEKTHRLHHVPSSDEMRVALLFHVQLLGVTLGGCGDHPRRRCDSGLVNSWERQCWSSTAFSWQVMMFGGVLLAAVAAVRMTARSRPGRLGSSSVLMGLR